MYLDDVAKIIYVPGTVSEYIEIILRYNFFTDSILYYGKAKDLQFSDIMHQGWSVEQVLVDHSDESLVHDYNKCKIIEMI